MLRHGDDFVVLSTRQPQKEFQEHVSKHLMVKHLATMDACASNTRRFHTEFLERSHHRTVQGVNALSTKPDPQHAKLIIHQLGLSSLSRSVFTPNEKSKTVS